MKTQKTTLGTTSWTAMAGLMIAGFAMASIGCGSSSSATGTGGSTGSGGITGAGGGSGGAAVNHKISYTFDTDKQGWVLSTFADTTSVNLAGAYVLPDAGTDGGDDAGTADAGATTGATAPTLDWDSANGNPTPGSLKVTATFTAYGQYVDAIFQTLMPTVDLHTGQLHAKLQILSVSSGNFTGGAQMHASTGTDYSGYAKQDFPPFTGTGIYTTATLDMSTQVAPVDATKVIQVGIQIFTGTAMPAGTLYPTPQTVSFNIDTVTD